MYIPGKPLLPKENRAKRFLRGRSVNPLSSGFIMKNNFGLSLASSFLTLVLSLISVLTTFGQSPNPPSLSITPQREPQISVHGLSGARYQLQYNPDLNPTNWQVLTNFILGTSPYTVVDSNAPLAGKRMYRALLLETNASVSYAPTTLTSAEVFRFTSQGTPTLINDTLVLNSPTTGIFLQQNNSPGSGISPVTVTYMRLGPFLAQMSVIRPPSAGFPSSQTNFYTIVFTGPSAGFFQVTDGVTQGIVGEFSRDQSFVGQQIAPAQLTGGEIYSLLTTNFGITNLTTLVINSPTGGMLITPGNPSPGSITPVSIQYQLLGPLSSQLSVIFPASSGFPTPQTNLYYLLYSAANVGSYQSISGPAIATLGTFARNLSFVGQQLASLQLASGEIFSLLSTNAGITNLTTLIINSTNSGTLIPPVNPPSGTISSVSIEYLRLGPLSGQMQVIIAPSSGFLSPKTNLYYFVFASTNSGTYQSITAPSIYTLGPFTRDLSLVGQQLAPAQLTAGESYSLFLTNAGITNLTTLVINSPTGGMLILPGNPSPGSITPVSIEYQVMGTLSSQLRVIIPPSGGFLTPQTNLYQLVYSSGSSGTFQSVSGPSTSVGSFTRNVSLVGQQIALAQLAAGEVYSLLTTNFGSSNVTSLVINSTTSGMLVSPGNPPPTGASITTVTIDYLRLGPLASQLQVVIPPSNGFPTAQTNLYYLVYSSINAGSYQSISGPAMANLGPFTRSRSLVGQQIAPAQLTIGESYRLVSSNGTSVVVEALVVNSATNGILVVEGSGPDAGIFPNVALQYLMLGNLSGQLQMVIPSSPPMILTPRTNNYLLVYTSNNTGQFQRATDPGMVNVGQFTRNPAQ